MFSSLKLNEMYANSGLVAHEIVNSYPGLGKAIYAAYKESQENPVLPRRNAVRYARQYGVPADTFQEQNELSPLR